MYCPECEQKRQDQIKTKVVDSRLQSSSIVRRRRECKTCGYRFNTWESTMIMDSRKTLSRIMKKRMSKIKEQAQEIIDGIKDE